MTPLHRSSYTPSTRHLGGHGILEGLGVCLSDLRDFVLEAVTGDVLAPVVNTNSGEVWRRLGVIDMVEQAIR